MTTITANIPARTIGKVTLPAHVDTFARDADGRWTKHDDVLGKIPVFEAEVIDVCELASNWRDIRAEHFPMHGFHA